jgi:hypothetical protein
VALILYFISIHLYNTHQVLVGLPQGVGDLANLSNLNFIVVYVYKMYQVLVGLPQGVEGLAILLCKFHIVYFNTTHQVLVMAPPRGAWWHCYFILYCINLFQLFLYNTH